ncbi:serine acetyltransferase [Kocuria rosea]|nr:serine acetyltransferase [Kocuria rosea]
MYNLAHKLNNMGVPVLPRAVSRLIRIAFSCSIPPTAVIGGGTILGYGGLGIVIHSRAIIGKHCVISPHVVIGGTSQKRDVPIIGNNVHIGAGAKILGPVEIGDNVVIGANSVVLSSVESNTLVAGVPAKVIKRQIDASKY